MHDILVIGCGSIGERHIRTLLATGRASVRACDSNPVLRQQMAERYGATPVADWRLGVSADGVDGVVIATPAHLHIPMALAVLEAGKPVLIEKPLSVSLAGVQQLKAAHERSGVFAGLAYIYHFVPAFSAAREFLRTGKLGPVRHVVMTSGQHFPFFRPAYREIYYRDPAQGGGAIQDAVTHMANVVEWTVGPTTRVYCDAAHQALEGVTVEDTVNIAARNGEVLVCYALNQFQAPNEIRMDFNALGGTVRVELHAQRWGTRLLGKDEWIWRDASVAHRDNWFVAQSNAFLDGLEGRPNELCTLREGIQTLRFNLAALESWRERLPVEIPPEP